LVTFGYWTTDICNVFELKPLLKKFSISQLDAHNNAALQADFSTGMAALINARAILYQVIPQLTIITIFACNMSATPLFVRNTEIAKHLPDLVAWTAYQDCKDDQKENWATILQVTNFFVLNSRLLVALVSLYRTSLSVGLLYGSVYSWVLSSVCILLPIACARSLQWIIFLGKGMSVRDVDILAAFCIKSGGLQQGAEDRESNRFEEQNRTRTRSRLSFSGAFGAATNFFKSSNGKQANEGYPASEKEEVAAKSEKIRLDEEANARASARRLKFSVTKYESISRNSNDEEEESVKGKNDDQGFAFSFWDDSSDEEEEDSPVEEQFEAKNTQNEKPCSVRSLQLDGGEGEGGCVIF